MASERSRSHESPPGSPPTHRRGLPGQASARSTDISGFILRRLLLGVLTLFFVSVIVFAATQALPGDPARAILGRTPTPRRARRAARAAPPQPARDRAVLALAQGLLTATSARRWPPSSRSSDVIRDAVQNSAFLVALAALIAVPLSLAIGVLGGPQARLGRSTTLSALVLLALAALPEFVIGIGLVAPVRHDASSHVLPPAVLAPTRTGPVVAAQGARAAGR